MMRQNLIAYYGWLSDLVGKFGFDELAVQAGDVGNGFVLGANGFAGTGIRAVTETELVHFRYHSLCALGCFGTSLRKQGKLAYLGADEEHGGTVLTSGNAGTAADASGAVHSLVCILLGNKDGIGVLRRTGAYRYITACSLDFIKGGTIYHAVLDNGESGGTPRFDRNHVAVIEAAHIELAGSGTRFGLAVRRTVNIERTHTADAFAAVVVEDERFLAVFNQFLIEDIEHLKERSVIGDVVHLARIEVTRILRTILLPVLYCKAYVLSHFGMSF